MAAKNTSECNASANESTSSKFNLKRFHFTSNKQSMEDACEEITVYIPEIIDPHYSMYTWPSAAVVAQYIWFNRSRFKGQNIVELGAGTALCGIVAALCEANVTLADNLLVPESMENCKRSCEANNLVLKILGIKWGHFNVDLLGLTSINCVILSDCFYDPNEFEDILVTVAFILDRNPGCKCIVGYQVRCTNWTICDLLAKWRLTSTDICLKSFHGENSCLAGSDLPGRHTIQILEISKI